ncbi:hypothetical protein J5226_10510 [Lysobacter sp. K5869]|uniref:hypothetical protein n=1 Tax=Lysobacter sp. K5869 TaxID=2820808 RepID=UPI001C063527|nr:hypothetical protein [Lysobacter sp. K5869]QWP78788.1 hypothetical protein J5226_10510 [Lysobacter sp. K5869]
MPLAAGSAVEAARSLYDLHMRLHASGLPVGEDLARYRPLLSKRLLALMAPAARERDRTIAQTPDLKPPYIEGDMFTGLSEGATGYKLGKRNALGPDRESVDLEFVYDDGSGPPTRWRGRAQMVREDGSWKLDEVEYGDFDAGVQGDFVRAGSLSDWFK